MKWEDISHLTMVYCFKEHWHPLNMASQHVQRKMNNISSQEELSCDLPSVTLDCPCITCQICHFIIL